MSAYIVEKLVVIGFAAAVAFTVGSYVTKQFNHVSVQLSKALTR